MNIGLFHATIKDAKPYVKNDENFREFLRELEGKSIEIIIRLKDGDKYSLLTKEWRKEISDFLATCNATEASAFATWTANGEDSLDIARHLAELRLAEGGDVPKSIIQFFRLESDNRLFPDAVSKESMREAVSA